MVKVALGRLRVGGSGMVTVGFGWLGVIMRDVKCCSSSTKYCPNSVQVFPKYCLIIFQGIAQVMLECCPSIAQKFPKYCKSSAQVVFN